MIKKKSILLLQKYGIRWTEIRDSPDIPYSLHRHIEIRFKVAAY